jgi:hypothetical protein
VDLGLLVPDEKNRLRPANALYQEVMARVLIDPVQSALKINDNIIWNDGHEVLVTALLEEFQKFWRKHANTFPLRINKLDLDIDSFKSKIKGLESEQLLLEILDLVSSKYDEAVYYVILMAFLQRVVNGGATVHRQLAEGRGAVDLAIVYNEKEYLIEVKLKGRARMDKHFTQLARYMDVSGVKNGWLVIFDKDKNKKWEDKIYHTIENYNNLLIHIFGC